MMIWTPKVSQFPIITINRETNRFKTMTNYKLSWISQVLISCHKMKRMKKNGFGVVELM